MSRPTLWALAIIIPALFTVVLSATGLWLGSKHLSRFTRRKWREWSP